MYSTLLAWTCSTLLLYSHVSCLSSTVLDFRPTTVMNLGHALRLCIVHLLFTSVIVIKLASSYLRIPGLCETVVNPDFPCAPVVVCVHLKLSVTVCDRLLLSVNDCYRLQLSVTVCDCLCNCMIFYLFNCL